MRAAILIVSSGISSRSVPDEVGPLLASVVEAAGAEVAGMEVLPDDYALIEDRLHHFVEDECELILTAGGIGPSLDHVTAEATLAVLDREAPGVSEAIRARDPQLMLTRGISGFAGGALVVNLPGDAEAARRAFAVIAPMISRD